MLRAMLPTTVTTAKSADPLVLLLHRVFSYPVNLNGLWDTRAFSGPTAPDSLLDVERHWLSWNLHRRADNSPRASVDGVRN